VTAAGGTISLLVGAVLLRLSLTGTYERYVRVGMGPWLIVAGIAVLVFGFVTLARALRGAAPVDAHDHGDDDHHHAGGIGVGWLLLAPIAALLLVAPPTLGSYGVGRAASIDVRAGAPVFDPLPRSSEPVPMSLLEYGQRSFDHNGLSVRRVQVQLTGFASGAAPGGFKLARYQISCCAADAVPAVVQIVGTEGQPPSDDQWVTVTGTFVRAQGETPRLQATSVVQIPTPNDPYE
jgi:uncharacterized repeat protein (TIGR03943 family)